MSRVYLAGRFSRRAEFNGYADRLREAGHTVDARWLTEEHEWYGGTAAEELAAAREFAMDDLADVAQADVVLVFTEPPNPGGRNRGGRHVEYGIAIGMRKDIVVVGQPENVFHNLGGHVLLHDPDGAMHQPSIRIRHAADFDEALVAMDRWQEFPR